MDWIKVKTRELNSEEREEYPDVDFMWDMETPENDSEVLVSDGESVWTDTWADYDVYGCDFENTDITEAKNLWYMPFPKPPKIKEVEW